MTWPALEVEHLGVRYGAGRGFAALRSRNTLRAVEDVSLSVEPREILGIAGESGCGKSSLANAVLGLVPIAEGDIRLDGLSVRGLSASEWRPIRSRVQMVFQDPFESLNPRFTVMRSVAEPLLAQGTARGKDLEQMVIWALEQAQLRPPSTYLHRYPAELSGGERQRVAIARALVVQPRLIIADEPVSMLDAAIGEEVVALLRRLTEELDVAVLLISHDLALLAGVCDRIGVMYLGRLVEIAPAAELIRTPRHPYTQALVDAIPLLERTHPRPRLRLPGEPPLLSQRPPGCPFHPRCSYADSSRCAVVEPSLEGIGHQVACYHPLAGEPEPES